MKKTIDILTETYCHYLSLEDLIGVTKKLTDRCLELEKIIKDLETQKSIQNSDKLNSSEAIKDLIIAASIKNKIGAIKCVRALLGLGLKESKDFVESLDVNWKPLSSDSIGAKNML